MPVTTDREVFGRFMESGASREVALLAFASYAEAKYDWETHFTILHSKAPTDSETERWITDHSDARLAAILAQAVNFWDEAAKTYMSDQIIAERKQAVDQSILARIEKATSFGSTFLPNLFVGIVASFAFTLLVILAGLIFEKDPSPLALLKRLETPTLPASSK